MELADAVLWTGKVKVIFLCCVGIAAVAWVRYAEHPTAKNLRVAISDTLGLL